MTDGKVPLAGASQASSGFAVWQVVWILVAVSLFTWIITTPEWLNLTDPMTLSGFLAVIAGIIYSVLVDRSLRDTIGRWHDAAIFDVPDDQRPVIESHVFRMSVVMELLCGLITFCVIVLAYIYIENKGWELPKDFKVMSFICAFLVGLRLGRVLTHELIAVVLKKEVLKRQGVEFHITVPHPDRTGGVAQVGSFYLKQAYILFIPTIWLLFWRIMIMLGLYSNDYTNWATVFNIQLVIMFLFMGTMLVPIMAFRRLMRDWKHGYLHSELRRVRAELVDLCAIGVPSSVEYERRCTLANYLYSLNNLPDVPVSPGTFSGFVTTFVTTCLLPLIISVAAPFINALIG